MVNKIEHHLEFIRYLVNKGGPEKNDYDDLDSWVLEISEQVKDGRLLKNQIVQLQDEFGDAISCETMQGFAYQKPHGYAGDYEIIDRIYQKYISKQSHLTRWDIYWQKLTAADAVRNRVKYFSLLLKEQYKKKQADETLNVLNLASGPGRDLLYFLDHYPDINVYIDCVEQDQNAIDHATGLCKNHLNKVNFIKKNAVRFKTEKKYDLVWSAGLFDYFDDKLFVYMLKKLKGMVASEGEIVIGNFSTNNPSKPFMELFEWHLHHRSPETLKKLAATAGFDAKQIRVKKEELGVNLFLHLTISSK